MPMYGANGFSSDRRLDVKRSGSILGWVLSGGTRPDPLSPDEFAFAALLAVTQKDRFLGLLEHYWRRLDSRYIQSLQDLAEYQRRDRRVDWAYVLDEVATGLKTGALGTPALSDSWQRFTRSLLSWLPAYLSSIPDPPGNDNRAVFPKLIACDNISDFVTIALGESAAKDPHKAERSAFLRYGTEYEALLLPPKMALLFEMAVTQLALWDTGLANKEAMRAPCVRPIEMMIECAQKGGKHDLWDCVFLGWTALAHAVCLCSGLQPSHLELMAEVIEDDMVMLKKFTDPRLRTDVGQASLFVLGALNILHAVLQARLSDNRRVRSDQVSQARQSADTLDDLKKGRFGFAMWLDRCVRRLEL